MYTRFLLVVMLPCFCLRPVFGQDFPSHNFSVTTAAGSALQFDGIDDYVEVQDTDGTYDLNDFTLEAWVIRMEENSTGVIIHKGAGGENPSANTNFGLFFRDDNLAHAIWEHADSRNFEVIGTTPIESNRWYHIAGVRSAADHNLRIYVNGELDAPPLHTEGTPNIQNVPLRFGHNDDGFPAEEHFKGIIDEIRIWNIPRTPIEIQQGMNASLSGNEPGLVGYWRLDEGEGQFVRDASSTGSQGLLGSPTTHDSAEPAWVSSTLVLDAVNHALLFDGQNDFVLIPDKDDSLDMIDFSIECWVQILSTGKIHELVVKDAFGEDPTVNSNYSFDVWSNERLRIVFENENQDNQELFGETQLVVGEWYHVAATFDRLAQTLALYLNGELDAGPLTVIGRPNNQNQSIRLGTGYEGVPRTTAHAVLDEVRIWKTVRTAEQLKANMNVVLSGHTPGLAGYWRFNEGTGQNVHDTSWHGQHGQRGNYSLPDSSDPKWVLSTITPASCSGIPLPSAEAYGKIHHGDQDHVDRVTFCFESFPDDAYLSFQAYDIDTYDEVDVRVNGTHLFDVPVTAENSWSGLMGVLVPQWLLREHEANELVFDNTKNPPKSWYWGVRQVSIDPFYALPSNEPFGKIPGGDQSHADKVVHIFSGQPGDLTLSYEVYDIDSIHELDLILNGEKIDDAVPTANNSWSSQRETSLPDWLVNDAGLNVLVFENTKNPPLTWNWGVRNVGVEIAGQSSALVNLPEGTLVNGNLIKDGNYLVDGVAIPPARANGDDSPNTNAIEGAALISPSGHLVIDLGNATEFDGLMLQPEWNHQRFVSYRIESSLNGADWRALVDKSDAAVQGIQFSKTPNAQARFLRITGSSHVANVEALPANGSEDRDYWREYEAMIASAPATDLAVAELRLMRTQGETSVNERETTVPTEYDLEQNFPNPFNPTTTLRFSLPQAGHAKLQVFDVKGELVRTVVEGEQAAGYHAFSFDASGLASGTYYYRLEAGEFVATRKMILMR